MDIEGLQKASTEKFNSLLIKKWGLEHNLQAITEEMAKEQGKYEVLEQLKGECVKDDS